MIQLDKGKGKRERNRFLQVNFLWATPWNKNPFSRGSLLSPEVAFLSTLQLI